jgi:trigger factor
LKAQVAVVDVSQVRKDLTVEVTAEEVKAEFEKTYDAYARYGRVPGFRQGKAPRNLLKQHFAKDAKKEVLSRLLPHALQHAVSDHHLKVIGEPQVVELSFEEGEPLRFKVSLEVLPEFELQEYKGLQLVKRVHQVTDENVEQVIQHFRESRAEFVTIDERPAQLGDYVSVNLVGKYIEPPEAEDLKSEGVQFELGGKNVQEEFTENLLGAQSGEVREFRVSYPTDFSAQGLAGKTLDFTATVVAVREKELPAADDEFAQGFGEYESIQHMRRKIHDQLRVSAHHQADLHLRNEALRKLLEGYEFEIPASLVEQQAVELVQNLAQQMVAEGIPVAMVKTLKWDEPLAAARIQAALDVRATLVLARIGQKERIPVSEAEVDAEIERLAAGAKESPEALKARLTKEEALSSIEHRLRRDKVLDFIVSNAEITLKEVTTAELEEKAKAHAASQAPTDAPASANQSMEQA